MFDTLLLLDESQSLLHSYREKIDYKLYCYLISSSNFEADLKDWLNTNQSDFETEQYKCLQEVFNKLQPNTFISLLVNE